MTLSGSQMGLALLSAALTSGVLCDANRSSSISSVTSPVPADSSSFRLLQGQRIVVVRIQMPFQACVGPI